jgi:intracellular sulfur oxidation DsrE/DsrF family protein
MDDMPARSILKLAAPLMVLALATGCAGLQAPGDTMAHRMVFQVIDNDPGRWRQALNIARNLKKDMGKENVDIEIVAHGGGLKMVLMESEVATLMSAAQGDGVVLAACAATMKGQKVTDKDLHDGVKVVPFGAKEIMQKQEAGWSYLRM